MRVQIYNPRLARPHDRSIHLRGFAGPVEVIKEVIDEAQGWAIIAELQKLYIFSEGIVSKLTPTTIGELFLMYSPIGPLLRYAAPETANELISSWKKQALANIYKDKDYIVDLRTRLWNAAKSGALPDGTPYTWTKWRAFAKVIADELYANIKYQIDANVFSSIFELIARLVIKTVRIVTDPLDGDSGREPPFTVPWYVWGLGGVVALGLVANSLNSVKAFLPSALTRAVR